MNDRLKLNVGGTIFETTKSTLEKSLYFRKFFKHNYNKDNESIFIDRSPHIFKHVLSLLRDPSYYYPLKYKSELEYFQIDDMIKKMSKCGNRHH